jgi:hypothetical protein
MSHQYFDVFECVAMPTVRFIEKVEPVWHRQGTKITLPRYVFTVPQDLIEILAKKEVNQEYKMEESAIMFPISDLD